MKRFTTRLDKCTSTDKLQIRLNYVHFKDGYVAASNGRILIRQQLTLYGFDEADMDLMHGKSIDRTDFARLYNCALEVTPVSIIGTKKNGNKVTCDLLSDTNPPSFVSVIPDPLRKTGDGTMALDLKNMGLLALALINPTSTVILTGENSTHPYLVRSRGKTWEEETGIILPAI